MSLVNPINVTSVLSENSLQGFPNFKAMCFKFTPLTLPSAPLERFVTSADKGTRNQTDLWAYVKNLCPHSRNTQTPILQRYLGSRQSNPKTIGFSEQWVGHTGGHWCCQKAIFRQCLLLLQIPQIPWQAPGRSSSPSDTCGTCWAEGNELNRACVVLGLARAETILWWQDLTYPGHLCGRSRRNVPTAEVMGRAGMCQAVSRCRDREIHPAGTWGEKSTSAQPHTILPRLRDGVLRGCLAAGGQSSCSAQNRICTEQDPDPIWLWLGAGCAAPDLSHPLGSSNQSPPGCSRFPHSH